jgi:surface antigen
MPPTITDRVAELSAEATTINDTALDEARPLTDEEQARFDAILDGLKRLGALDKSTAAATAILDRAAVPSPTPTDFGQAFVDSHVVQAIRAAYPGGIPQAERIAPTGAVSIGRVMDALQVNPNLTPERVVYDVPTGVAVLDLMQAITVIDDAPETIRHFTATFTNAAAIVPESDGDPEDTVGVKPESGLVWANVPLTQEVIGHVMPVTNQALNRNAMLRQYINTFMVNGVRAKVQSTVATQMAAWSGLNTQAFSTNLRTTLRKAITKAQTAQALTGGGPISIAISAIDAEALDLEMLASLTLSPGEAPQQASGIWRAPLVVVAGGLPSGYAYVGDLKQVIWYTSGDVNLAVGLVNDQFNRNEQTIRAETEGVTGVLNAGAIVKADVVA